MYPTRRNIGDIAGEDVRRLLSWALEGGQPGSVRRGTWLPALDIFETEDAITVLVDLPGVQSEDLDVSIEEGVLVIRGVRQSGAGQDANYHRIERPVGEFQRSVQLPRKIEADKITANIDAGVLTVRIPAPESPKARKIAVNTGSGKPAPEERKSPENE